MNFQEKIKKVITANERNPHQDGDSANEIIADVRNKLSPIENLLAMLEDVEMIKVLKHLEPTKTKFIEKEINQVKISIKYLSNN